MTVDCVAQSCSSQVACTTDDDVLSNVEVVMELFNLVGSDRINNILVPSCGLTEIVILYRCIDTLKAV